MVVIFVILFSQEWAHSRGVLLGGHGQETVDAFRSKLGIGPCHQKGTIGLGHDGKDVATTFTDM